MTCCDYGKCDQGKDCPIRKQRIKEINDAYINGYNDAHLGDPLDDLADTFRALLAMVTLVLSVWIFYLVIWGK